MITPKPLAERVQGMEFCDLSRNGVLAQRLPAFFQGVAAITGLRCHRENLELWRAWEKKYYKECNEKPYAAPVQARCMDFWLCWAGLETAQDWDAEMFVHLLLEPMHYIAESRRARPEMQVNTQKKNQNNKNTNEKKGNAV